MKNILLVSPDFDIESFWITEEEGTRTEVLNDIAPLGLATVAALTPESYNVDIWDEVVHGKIGPETQFKRNYDLVGFTGYNTHYLRCMEIVGMFRDRGVITAVGGPGVSGLPERYRDHFDVLFIGEAERTWPQFLKDWENGGYRSEYRQIEKIDLAESPPPRWDSITNDMSKYAMGGVQTSRGCPFDCEFCDVIYLFGRKIRHKPVENVIAEVKALERIGVTSIMFSDDEFVGNPQYAKELLRALIPVNNSFERPLTYTTQVSMNLSRSKELLELFADINFGLIFVGIETPNKAALEETGKFHNVRTDLAADVKKILSYGIPIRAGLIVGFDNDTTEIFDYQDEFVHNTCLPSATLSMLKAIPGTRLWRRLRSEGRVLDITKIKGDSKGGNAFKPRSYTNIIPKSMTRMDLMVGYRRLAEKLYGWESFGRRMKGFVSNVTRRPRVSEPPLTDSEMADLKRVGASGPEAARAAEAIVSYTLKAAPFMMRKVRTLILQHAKHKQTFDSLLPYINRLVELEASGELSFNPDSRPVPIPEAFRVAFKRDTVFANVYRHIYEDLKDKSRAPDAVTEVFVDFIVRCGEGFASFEPHHGEYLRELSDRTCQKFNGMPGTVAGAHSEVAPDVRRSTLPDDILRSIEQELMTKIKRPSSSATGGGKA